MDEQLLDDSLAKMADTEEAPIFAEESHVLEGKPTTAFFADAFAEVERVDQRVEVVLLNPKDFDLNLLLEVVEATEKTGCYTLWGSHLFLHDDVPEGRVCLFGDKGMAIFIKIVAFQ